VNGLENTVRHGFDNVESRVKVGDDGHVWQGRSQGLPLCKTLSRGGELHVHPSFGPGLVTRAKDNGSGVLENTVQHTNLENVVWNGVLGQNPVSQSNLENTVQHGVKP
jgi:hypothetical protein